MGGLGSLLGSGGGIGPLGKGGFGVCTIGGGEGWNDLLCTALELGAGDGVRGAKKISLDILVASRS